MTTSAVVGALYCVIFRGAHQTIQIGVVRRTNRSLSVPFTSRPLCMLESQKRMSPVCADEWIAQGELCEDLIPT